MPKHFDQMSERAQFVISEVVTQKKDWYELIQHEQGKPLNVQILINGIEFDFEQFVAEVLDRMKKDIDNEAVKLLDTKICDMFALDELYEFLRETRHAVRSKLEKSLNITIERDF